MDFLLAFIAALLVMILATGAFIGGYFYGKRNKKSVKTEQPTEEDRLRQKHFQNLFKF
jgi:uncharacterized protein YneF (UPF0154 family)